MWVLLPTLLLGHLFGGSLGTSGTCSHGRLTVASIILAQELFLYLLLSSSLDEETANPHCAQRLPGYWPGTLPLPHFVFDSAAFCCEGSGAICHNPSWLLGLEFQRGSMFLQRSYMVAESCRAAFIASTDQPEFHCTARELQQCTP